MNRLPLLLVSLLAAPDCSWAATHAARGADSRSGTTSAPAAGSLAVNGTPLAFPGCEGAGCKTLGGFASGSVVYQVDSLSATATGCALANGVATGCSLADCLAHSGPAVCLFRVSGSIPQGFLVSNGQKTLDGTSAPGDGVTIRAKTGAMANLRIAASDVVVRGLKLRSGYNAAYPGDGSPARPINIIGAAASRIVIDHDSIQWGNGGQVSIWSRGTSMPITDTTVSWNIIGEGLDVTRGSGYGYNFVLGGQPREAADLSTEIDIHHNYLASGHERMPTFKVRSGRIVNNVIYNWESNMSTELRGGVRGDLIGNVWKPGNNSTDIAGVIQVWDDRNQEDSSNGTAALYMEGNISSRFPTVGDDWTSGIAVDDDPNLANLAAAKRSPYARLPTPSSGTEITVDPAGTMANPVGSVVGEDATADGTGTNAGVLGLAGAVLRVDCGGRLVMRRDSEDSKMVRYWATPASTPNLAPRTEAGYGGFPSTPAVSASTVCAPRARDNRTCRCADANGDGIPDLWERTWCGSATGCGRTNSQVMPPYGNLQAYLSGRRPVP